MTNTKPQHEGFTQGGEDLATAYPKLAAAFAKGIEAQHEGWERTFTELFTLHDGKKPIIHGDFFAVISFIRTHIEAAQEDMRRRILKYISEAKMRYITEKYVLTHNGEILSTLLGSEKNYVSAEDLEAVLIAIEAITPIKD